jgi:hypothetical protein
MKCSHINISDAMLPDETSEALRSALLDDGRLLVSLTRNSDKQNVLVTRFENRENLIDVSVTR